MFSDSDAESLRLCRVFVCVGRVSVMCCAARQCAVCPLGSQGHSVVPSRVLAWLWPYLCVVVVVPVTDWCESLVCASVCGEMCSRDLMSDVSCM